MKIQVLAVIAVVGYPGGAECPKAEVVVCPSISTADFNALIEDLVGALDKFNVAPTDKSQLAGVPGPVQGRIVEKK